MWNCSSPFQFHSSFQVCRQLCLLLAEAVVVVGSQETMLFAGDISLNSLHTSTLTCLVSSLSEKTLFCVWSVASWQRLPPPCGWYLVSLPAAIPIRQRLLFPSSKVLRHEISFCSSLWRWGSQELRRTMPVAATILPLLPTHPFQNSGRTILPEAHWLLFFFSSNPSERVCGRKPCAPWSSSSWVKLQNCTLCQYQL